MKRKILTEIIGEHGQIIKRKKFPVESDTIIVHKGKKGPGGSAYKPKFTRNSFLWKKGFFSGAYKPKLMLMDGAVKCVEFNHDGVELAHWDKKTEEELFRANVIKAAGATTQKIQIPIVLYMIIMFVIILQVINIGIITGRIRI